MITAVRYDSSPPFVRRQYLRNVSDVSYASELMGAGLFRFRMPINDTQGVVEGDLIAFKSGLTGASKVPPFVGYVERIQSAEKGAYVDVTGREWAGLLEERTTLQERTYRGASGDIAREIVRRANGRNQMGITVLGNKASTPVIGPVTVRAQPVSDALVDIVALSGWEWQITYEAGVQARALFTWRPRAGFDMRRTVHLFSNVIVDAEYSADNLHDRQMVQIIGTSIGEFATRPSAIVTNDGPVAYQDMAQIRATSVRNPNQRTVKGRSVTTSREAVIINPDLPDRLSVARVARDEAIAAAIAGEAIRMTVGPSAPLRDLMPGNTITVHLPNARYGSGVSRPFRIYGFQPDENQGPSNIIGKVLP